MKLTVLTPLGKLSYEYLGYPDFAERLMSCFKPDWRNTSVDQFVAFLGDRAEMFQLVATGVEVETKKSGTVNPVSNTPVRV